MNATRHIGDLDPPQFNITGSGNIALGANTGINLPPATITLTSVIVVLLVNLTLSGLATWQFMRGYFWLESPQ